RRPRYPAGPGPSTSACSHQIEPIEVVVVEILSEYRYERGRSESAQQPGKVVPFHPRSALTVRQGSPDAERRTPVAFPSFPGIRELDPAATRFQVFQDR